MEMNATETVSHARHTEMNASETGSDATETLTHAKLIEMNASETVSHARHIGSDATETGSDATGNRNRCDEDLPLLQGDFCLLHYCGLLRGGFVILRLQDSSLLLCLTGEIKIIMFCASFITDKGIQVFLICVVSG